MGIGSRLEMPFWESAVDWRCRHGLDRPEKNGHPGLLQRKALQSNRAIMRRVAPQARRRGIVKGQRRGGSRRSRDLRLRSRRVWAPRPRSRRVWNPRPRVHALPFSCVQPTIIVAPLLLAPTIAAVPPTPASGFHALSTRGRPAADIGLPGRERSEPRVSNAQPPSHVAFEQARRSSHVAFEQARRPSHVAFRRARVFVVRPTSYAIRDHAPRGDRRTSYVVRPTRPVIRDKKAKTPDRIAARAFLSLFYYMLLITSSPNSDVDSFVAPSICR